MVKKSFGIERYEVSVELNVHILIDTSDSQIRHSFTSEAVIWACG
jgi:hypothetical protein